MKNIQLNPSKKPDFSLVLPCYNESTHILESIKDIINAINISKYTYEIILVDDKSTDNTKRLIKKIVALYPNTRAFFHLKNYGRGGTVNDGIREAKSNIVGFIDIDCEVSPIYIPRFVKIIKDNQADVVIAHRYYPLNFFPINDFIRTILSEGYSQIIKYFIKLPVEDTESGYKFFNRNKILPVLEQVENKHWFWDTEIMVRSCLNGLIIKEVPTLFLRRSSKKSTVRIIPDTVAYLKALKKFSKSLKLQYPAPPGLLYKFPKLYFYAMKFLYGKNYYDRYKKIAKVIKNNSSVVDVCCGDSELNNYLITKNVSYFGIDISLPFVLKNIRKYVRSKLVDIRNEEIPSADYVILQGSLYQFNNTSLIINKLYKAAKKYLIISEPIQNLDKNYFFKKTPLKILSSKIVSTYHINPHFRFNEDKLKELLKKYHPQYLKIIGQRDLIAVIKKIEKN